MKTCDICNASCKEINLYQEDCGKIKIYKCPQCELYFQNDILFDNDTSDYINWNFRETGLHALRLKNYKSIMDFLDGILTEDAVGLEVGSAYGWFLNVVNMKYTCYGIEADSKNILDNSGHKVFNGFFPDDLPMEVQNLDFIIFNDVFEHIPDCNKVIECCRKRLKKDGYLIINAPLSTGILYSIASHLNYFGKMNKDYLRLWQLKTNSPHLYYFNYKNIRLLGENHGFTEVGIIKLDTLDKNSIYERIVTVKAEKRARLKAQIMRLFFPIFHILPSDTGAVVLKKN